MDFESQSPLIFVQGPIQESGQTQHCVRCHKNFTPGTEDKCIIPHSFNPGSIIWPDPTGPKPESCYTSDCCGEYVVVVEHADGTFGLDAVDDCFRGEHATWEDLDKVDYNGKNIRPCKVGIDGKCVREYIEQYKRPVFDWEFNTPSEDEDDDDSDDSE